MERTELSRDCEVIKIPAGDRTTLPQGTEVYIQQSLGGSFTVQAPRYGGMFRISGRDADAIGQEVPEQPRTSVPLDGDLRDHAEAVLKTCFDPEIPVNIVDLGLVYDTRVTDLEDGTHRIEVKMTLTAPGCGMGASIAADAEEKLQDIPGVSEAIVGVVWDPPWGPQMISEEGRKKMGI